MAVGVNESTELPERSNISRFVEFATSMCVELDVEPVGLLPESNLNRNSVDNPYAKVADPKSEITTMPKMALRVNTMKYFIVILVKRFRLKKIIHTKCSCDLNSILFMSRKKYLFSVELFMIGYEIHTCILREKIKKTNSSKMLKIGTKMAKNEF